MKNTPVTDDHNMFLPSKINCPHLTAKKDPKPTLGRPKQLNGQLFYITKVKTIISLIQHDEGYTCTRENRQNDESPAMAIFANLQ